MSPETTAAKKKKGQRPEAKPKDKAKGDYSLAPKDKAWLDSKLRDYTALIGKSMDAEADFAAKQKEWLAAMKIGRQSARDRFRAGKILMVIQQKITEEIGHPFWPWLKAMGVPDKTAQRAIELAKHYKTEDRLGDKTITECYADIKAAKAKTKVEVKNGDDNSEEDGEQEANDGKMDKDLDNVSNPSPILPMPNSDEPEGNKPDDEEKELYGQEELTWDLEGIEELLQEALKSLSGELGPFPNPEKIVKHIDKCIGLLDELKSEVPVQVEVA